MGKKALFLGSVMVDVVCPIDFFPQPGNGIVSEESRQAVGGCAFNAANIARQLGASCQLFAPLGKGMYASFLKRELEARGYETFEFKGDYDCGAAICLVQPDGERTMITIPGIERHFESSWFEGIDTSEYSYVYVCGYEIGGSGGEAILSFLEKNAHLQIVFAPGPTICLQGEETMRRINALRPIWHLNDQEAHAYTGCESLEDAGHAIERQCQNTVLITEGPVGCHVFEKGEYALVPTTPVKPLDTIGAGDSNIGTYIAARMAEYSSVDAADFANRVSAEICKVSGATFSDEEFKKLELSL